MGSSLSIPTEGHGFSRLPIELRTLIWRQIITRYGYARYPLPRSDLIQLLGTGQPITLQINHESRVETLRVYQLLFQEVNGRGLYFDPLRDSLHLGDLPRDWESIYPQSLTRDLALVQSLVIFDGALAEHYRRSREIYTGLQTLAVPELFPWQWTGPPSSGNVRRLMIAYLGEARAGQLWSTYINRDATAPDIVFLFSRSEGGGWNMAISTCDVERMTAASIMLFSARNL